MLWTSVSMPNVCLKMCVKRVPLIALTFWARSPIIMREVYLWSPRQSQTSPAQLGVQSSWCFARFADGQRMVRSDQSCLEYNTHVEWHGTLAVFCNHTKLKHRSGYSQEVFSRSWLSSFHFKMNWFLETDMLQHYRTTILHQWYRAMPRQHSEDSEVSIKSCWSLSFRMPIVPWTTMKCATFKTPLGLLCPFFLGKRCFTVGRQLNSMVHLYILDFLVSMSMINFPRLFNDFQRHHHITEGQWGKTHPARTS